MQIYPLLYFKTVAETGNLTRAARLLMISPPALSNALKRLERDLGAPLFDRVGRNLTLNDYGKAYLPYVRRILALTEQGNDRIRQMRQEREHRLAVADMTQVFASHVISEFLEQYPFVSLRRVYVSPMESREIDLLGEFDFVIGSTNGVDRPDLQRARLRSGQTVVAVVNRHNPVAAKGDLTTAELKDLPMIAYARGMPGRKMLERIFEPLGKAPNVIYEGNSPHAMAPALERDLGVFLQPAHTARFNLPFYPDCVTVPVRDCFYEANTSLLWNPNRRQTEAAALFREFCEAFCASGGQTDET